MASLYTLNKEYLDLCDLIEEGEVDDDVLLDTLEAIEGDFFDKADKIANVIAEINGSIAFKQEEVERINKRIATDKNTVKRLTSTLFNAMVLRNDLKFKTDLHSFNIQLNGGVQPLIIAEGTKAEDLPAEYQQTKTEIKINNDAVRKALESGETLPFARLGERGRSLRIR